MLPGESPVVGTENAARVDIELLVGNLSRCGGCCLVRLYDSVNNMGLAPANAETATTIRTVRQTTGHFLPGDARVTGFVKARGSSDLYCWIAASEGIPAHLVSRGIKQVGIFGIHGQVDAAGVFVDGKDLLP